MNAVTDGASIVDSVKSMVGIGDASGGNNLEESEAS